MAGRFVVFVGLVGMMVAAVFSTVWMPVPTRVLAQRSAPDAAVPILPIVAPEEAPPGESTGATSESLEVSQENTAPSVPNAETQVIGELGGLSGLLRAVTPIRIPKPAVPEGPRRIGLQVGHWQTQDVPDELRRLEHATGASWGRVSEWQVNFDVANRTAAILRGHGYVVDILPTTVPSGYLADVFISLHADGDTDGSGRGYKAAHGSRRGPYEDQLVRILMEEYGRATGLPVDPKVTRNMLGYYAFSWSRFKSAVAPHTPAAILEMGFLTNATDRTVLLQQPDRAATGVANAVLRFLEEVPAGAAFANDLVVPPPMPFRSTSGSVGS